MIGTPKQMLFRGRIPREPFRTIWVHRMEQEGILVSESREGSGQGSGLATSFDGSRENIEHGTIFNTLSIFSDRVGVQIDTIRSMLFRKGKNGNPVQSFDFNICDKIICGLGGVSVWLEPTFIDGQELSLADHYHNVNLRKPEELKEDVMAGVEIYCGRGHLFTPQTVYLHVHKGCTRPTVRCSACHTSWKEPS